MKRLALVLLIVFMFSGTAYSADILGNLDVTDNGTYGGKLDVTGDVVSKNIPTTALGATYYLNAADAWTIPATVTNITKGNGMTFTAITDGTGSITLGAPGAVTGSSTDAAGADTHTHSITESTIDVRDFSNGATDAGTFLKNDMTWDTPGGGGDVILSGTQADNELAVWSNGSKGVDGDTNLTWNGTNLTISGNIVVDGNVDGVDVSGIVPESTAVGDTTEIDLTLTSVTITADLIDSSVIPSKLEASSITEGYVITAVSEVATWAAPALQVAFKSIANTATSSASDWTPDGDRWFNIVDHGFDNVIMEVTADLGGGVGSEVVIGIDEALTIGTTRKIWVGEIPTGNTLVKIVGWMD